MHRRALLSTATGLALPGFAGCVLDGEDAAPEATIEVGNQTSAGDEIGVETVETDVAATLEVTDADGSELTASSVTFGAGAAHEDYVLELDPTLESTTAVEVALVSEEHGTLAADEAEVVVEPGDDAGGGSEEPRESDGGEERDVELATGEVTRIEAALDDGFEFAYHAALPDELGADGPILVEPNNTGTATDDDSAHLDAAAEAASDGLGREISEALEVPLLVPAFPRPRSEPVDWHHYVHALDDDTMAIDDGPLERVDRQLLAMVDDLRERLSDRGYDADEQVLLDGFSASGNFVNRFAALHPGRVRSVTAGAINGTAILPREEAKGRELPYPIGVADLPELTGEPFDREAWTDVAQFCYMGTADENDTIPYDDAWNEELREIALDVYGEDMQADRMPYCESVYASAGADAQFHLYEGVGHTWNDPIVENLVAFHRRQLDGEFDPIEPYTFDPESGPLQLSLAEQPADGDEEVRVEVAVDEDVAVDDASVMVYDGPEPDWDRRIEVTTEPRRFVEPGVSDTRTVLLDPDAAGVPLSSGQTVTVGLVLGSPVVHVTTTVE